MPLLCTSAAVVEVCLLLGGVLPSLIQWESPPPAARLPEAGLRLLGLTLSTPDPARLERALGALGLAGTPLVIGKGPPRLEATLSVNGRGKALN